MKRSAGCRYEREELDRWLLLGWQFDRNHDSYRGWPALSPAGC
jgi:hypothetical protein